MTPADSTSDTPGSSRKWLLVAVLLLINTYAFVDRAVLSLLVEPIKHDLGVSDVQMGLLLGIGFAFFYSAFSIPAGHFVDRHGRRMIIGFASIFWALMTILCGTANSIEVLFVGRAGVGIAESVIAPAAFSLIRDAVPRRSRGLAFSVYAMAPLIGSATSLLIGGHILGMAAKGAFAGWPLFDGFAPWQCTLIIVGLAGLPLSLLLLLAPEPARPAPEAGEAISSAGMMADLMTALRHMRQHIGLYLPLILFVTCGAMANFAKSSWVPALLGRTWDLQPQAVGPMMGTMVLTCGMTGLLFSGFVLNWLTVRGGDIRTYGLIAAAGAMIGMVGIGLAPSLPFALAMVGFSSFFLGTSYSVGATTLGQVAPARLTGRVTGVYFLFQSLLGTALGPFLVAYGSQNMFTGKLALAHSFSLWTGVYGVAMIAAVVVLRRRLQRRAGAEVRPAAASA